MDIFRVFQRTLIKNYIIGTLTAVFGISSLFIFKTIILSFQEILLLLGIMVFSTIIMIGVEYTVYKIDSLPIKNLYEYPADTFPPSSHLQLALSNVQRFPILAVRRTLIFHFLGMTFPAVSLTSVLIYFEQLSLPYSYLLLAILGAFLISAMHALIEFFLTLKAIQPLMTDLTRKLYSTDDPFENRHPGFFLGIKKKLLISSLFLAVFPVFIFTLMSMAKVREQQLDVLYDFSKWAGLFLVILIALAFGGAILMSENIQQPIEEINEGMFRVRNGTLEPLENKYTDEFSELISGFNHMVAAIKVRDEQNKIMLESIYSLMAATLDARDSYTAGHSMRVAQYSLEIGKKMHFNQKQLDLLRKSAIVHDIGKIGIRDDVLLKEERLSPDEFEQIKQHPIIGARILEQYNMTEELLLLVPGVKYHHERFDGKGYPEGLAGSEIPLFGRIIAIADAFDAMTSDRTYRKGMDVRKALTILEDGMGTQWDPNCTQHFIDYMNEKLASNIGNLKISV